MKILIIGSKGFIGSHLFDYLNSKGIPVLGCDVVTVYDEDNYEQIDATNSDYHSLFEKYPISVCINCSGAASVPLSLENPLKDFNLNTVNVFKILDALRRHQPSCKFINLSSAAVYGNPLVLPIKENSSCLPISPYGFHKMQAEQICKEFYEFYNIKTCSLRIFSAYGEGLKKQLLWDLYKKFLENDTVELFGTGNETRDFINILDILQCVELVIQNAEFKAEVYNIANGEQISINQITNLVLKELNFKGNLSFSGTEREGDPIYWVANIDTIKKLGYKQQISIEEGIKNYIRWAKGIE